MANAAFAKFQQKRAAAVQAAPRGSRFAGVRSAEPRNPYLQPGSYVLRVIRTEESSIPGKNPYFNVSVEVLASDCASCPVGYKTTIGYCTSSKAAPTSFPRIKAFAVAAAGFGTDAEYDAAEGGISVDDLAKYPPGEHPNAGMWIENASAGSDVFNDCIVQCYVSRGNDLTDEQGNPTGDFFREYGWAPYTDQEAAAQ
jgi:hypothetical protein